MTTTALDRATSKAQRLERELRQAERRIAELEAAEQRVRAMHVPSSEFPCCAECNLYTDEFGEDGPCLTTRVLTALGVDLYHCRHRWVSGPGGGNEDVVCLHCGTPYPTPEALDGPPSDGTP